MNRADLKERLGRSGVTPSVYSLDGGLPNEKYVIGVEPDGRWVTYYSERGVRTTLKHFATEAEACDDLFEQVMHDSSARTAKGTW